MDVKRDLSYQVAKLILRFGDQNCAMPEIVQNDIQINSKVQKQIWL